MTFHRIVCLTALLCSLPFSGLLAAEFDQRPVPVKTPPPDYPYKLKRDNVAGLVALQVTINANGDVAECTVVKSTHAEFEGNAVSAVKKWKFKPAQKDGAPVECTIVLPLKFSLDA